MSEDYSYSYSYTGSYTEGDDYSYSYSYTDSATADKAPAGKRVQQPSAASAAAAAAAPPAAKAKRVEEEETESYSYSYSYSEDYSDSETETAAPRVPLSRGGSTPTPAQAGVRKPPPTAPPAKAVARPVPAVAPRDTDTGSYSYSYSYTEQNDNNNKKEERGAAAAGDQRGADGTSYYSYSEDYGSYSYSDSYSYTGDSSYYYDYSSSGSDAARAARRPQGKAANAAGGDGDASSYYYSGDDSYYYYSSSNGSGTDEGYYYSESYTYSETVSQDSPNYDYSDSYEDSDYYYYSSDSRYDETTDEEEDYYYYYSSGASYTYSADSKSDSSTTSSYGYSSSNPSVMSVTETEEARRTVVLRAPADDTPRAPAAPKRCFVAPRSVEDAVWTFLQRLMKMQEAYEARRAAAAAAAAPPASFVQPAAAASPPASSTAAAAGAGGKEEGTDGQRGKKKHRFGKRGSTKDVDKAKAAEAEADEETQTAASAVPTKAGSFSARSLRIAFQVLRMNHLERAEALKNAPVPLPMDTMVDIFNTCVAARAKERVAQALLAHDPYRSGELPVSTLGGVLRRLGLGTSPVVGGLRISLAVSPDTVPELVMNVEQLVQPPPPPARASATDSDGGADAAAAAASEGAGEPPAQTVQWEVTPVYVARIVRKNAAAKKTTPVRWEHNAVYMGRHVIVRNVTSREVFERLKTHIEAATYLCVLAHVFSIHDADRGTVTVQYPQLVRSVLLAQPPQGRHTTAPLPKLLAVESLFRACFHPMEVLRSYEAGRGFPRYLHDWAVESTLHPTTDTEEKRRRNVVPTIAADSLHFLPPPPARAATEARLSFLLEKVRAPAKPPANARCFCLVSAVTAANVFLPAIEVPVRDVVASRKEPGTYTWVFSSKKHKKRETILHFAGPALDRIYVECCYATTDAALPVGESTESGLADAATLAGTEVTTVWCAGYAVFDVDGFATATVPVTRGSLLLLSDAPPAAAPEAGAAAPAAAVKKKKKTVMDALRLLGRLGGHKRKEAAQQASSVKVHVVRDKKPLVGAEKLPSRFLAFRRHVEMIAQLRAAVELIGKDTAHALQALRHQAARYIFAVAADAALLDQLCTLWKHRTRHWSKAERKDAQAQHTQLLACVAALYALNNCCASGKEHFAQALVKEKAMHMRVDAAAPLQPVRI